MRLTNLQNVSKESVIVELKDGTKVTLPPNANAMDVDIVEVDSLKGKVTYKENLTEVNEPSGKRKIFG